ncbi:MAG TPA: chloramphenicol acetyltransferase [Pyrinomonadaceae bacterium]|jgi:chloramphenicol O-acetyltransferase type A
MPRYLDTETWHRRQQFEFFKGFDNPFFNICARVDVTSLLGLARATKSISFFITYHFLSMKAANEVEPFRYRLRGDRVLIHDRIYAGTTLLLADESFTFVYFDYEEDFEVFHTRATAAVKNAQAGAPRLYEREGQDDLIHHSVIPWVAFTSISHARNWGRLDSVPKIAFGKYCEEGDRIKMPVSVEAHHALMDGLHVGLYFEKLESYFSNPRRALGL